MSINQAEKTQNYKAHDEAKIEQEFLKGTKDPELGVYCDMFSAKSAIARAGWGGSYCTFGQGV